MVKNLPANGDRRQRRLKFDLWVEKIPWKRKWQPTAVFLPGKSMDKEPGGLQSMGSQRVRHDLATQQRQHRTSAPDLEARELPEGCRADGQPCCHQEPLGRTSAVTPVSLLLEVAAQDFQSKHLNSLVRQCVCGVGILVASSELPLSSF